MLLSRNPAIAEVNRELVEQQPAKKAGEKYTTNLEKTEQMEFAAWCDRNSLPADWSAMHKKTTKRRGWPDFTLGWQGRVLYLEFKAPWGRLSEDQKQQFDIILNAGNRLEIVATSEEAKQLTREHFGLSF